MKINKNIQISGMGILELILSVGLMIGILLALFQQFYSLSTVRLMQQNNINNNNIFYAIDVLSKDISSIGYIKNIENKLISGASSLLVNLNINKYSNDSLVVFHQIDGKTGNRDCHNDREMNEDFILNTYWLDKNKDNGSIMCRGSGFNKTDRVINNIDDFSVWYGVFTSNSSINRFIKNNSYSQSHIINSIKLKFVLKNKNKLNYFQNEIMITVPTNNAFSYETKI